MKKHATIVKHSKGMFLAIGADLNKRELIQEGFCKGLSTVKQFYKMISRGKSKFSSYEYAPKAIITGFDLSNEKDNNLTMDDIWDPNLHTVDLTTGEVTDIPDSKVEFTMELDESIVDEPIETNNKSLQTIMETKSKRTPEQRRASALKGVATKRANLKAQVEEQAKLQLEAEAQAKAERKAISIAKGMATRQLNKAWVEAIAYNIEYDNAQEQLRLEAEHQAKLDLAEGKRIKKREAQIFEKAWVEAHIELTQYNSKTEDNPESNNPVNHNDMRTQKPVSKDTNKSKGLRVRRSFAKITEVGITVGSDLLIGGLVLTSDLVFLTAEAVAWGQAAVVKPLGLHPDATRGELKAEAITRAENRSAFVIALPVQAVALPKRLYKASKEAIKMRNDKGIVDIQNAEVVS